MSYFSVVVCRMCSIIFCLLFHVDPKNTELLFPLLDICSNNGIHYGVYIAYVHTQHYIIIIIIQTSWKVLKLWNACQVYSGINPLFSIVLYMIKGAECFQLNHFSFGDYENIWFIIFKVWIWIINHLSARYEARVCDGCLAMFLFSICHCVTFI